MEASYLVRTAPYAAWVQILCISLINVLPGDKSNHVPSFHLPQLYYFIAFATIMGWPALACGDSGWKMLANDVRDRIFGNRRCVLIVYAWCEGLSFLTDQTHYDACSGLGGHGTINKAFHVGASDLVILERAGSPDLELAFQNSSPFFTFRQSTLHFLCLEADILAAPDHAVCAHPRLHCVCMDMVPPWGCVKIYYMMLIGGVNHCCPGREQTLLQTLLLPLCTLPVLLPTPLLELRYFLIPYILMRAQLVDVSTWGLLLEGFWYGVINAGTMYVFLYKEREGVGRFMW